MKLSAKLRERGQVLVIAALLLPCLLAMAGMAIDIGSYASERRALQNAADSMALAGGQELPDSAAAQTAALSYADEHGVDTSDVTVSVSGGSTEPAVRVTIARPHDFVFMGILGVQSKDVGATAKAGKFSPGAGAGVVPWSITQGTVDGAASGDEVIIKYDSSGTGYGTGNFGVIRVDGNGSFDYESSAKYGSDYHICSSAVSNCTTVGCPASFPTACEEDSPECDGSECPPKTGNMTGGTKDAVDFRIGSTNGDCDTFDGAFDQLGASRITDVAERYAFDSGVSTGGRLRSPSEHHGAGSHPTYTPTTTPTNTPVPTNTPAPPTSTPGATDTPVSGTITPIPTNTTTPGGGPKYAIDPNCNPWSGGRCATVVSSCSRRVFLIPIIDDFGNGSSDPVTILGFALVFLEGYDGSCTGSSCDVRVRFVRADVTTGAFAGDYDPDSLNHFVKLVE